MADSRVYPLELVSGTLAPKRGQEALSDVFVNGDTIKIEIDTINLEGSIDIVSISSEELQARVRHPDLKPDPKVPKDTLLWAALQNASGGSWAGSVYDVDRITDLLEKGLKAENNK